MVTETAPKTRPWTEVWGLRNAQNAPWERPLNDAEMRDRGLNPTEYEPETNGRWAW